MFIICRAGHLGLYWEGKTLFIEKESGLFTSRKDCLRYLIEKCGLNKEDAVSAITLMQESKKWISF